MPAFVSPLPNPASWTYVIVDGVTIPDTLRYAGYTFRGVRAAIASATGVEAPATGVLRSATDVGGRVFVEVQVNPFPIRRVATAIAGGLPTFYLVFDDATGLTVNDDDGALGGTQLRTATAVTIVAVFQDRIDRDPAMWAASLASALATGGGDASQWQPFATALASAIATGDAAPVLLYDHAGRLRTSGQVDIVRGAPGNETTLRASITPADGGDLQRTVARMHGSNPGTMPIENLFGGGVASFRLRPVATVPGDVQLVRVDEGLTAATEIEVTPTTRSVAFTNLTDWFAAQYVTTTNVALARFTRGNLITPLVDGPSYFDDFFAAMREAQNPDGGVHLAGWAMFPQTKFTKRGLGDDPEEKLPLDQANTQIGPDDIPLTLEQAVDRITAARGQARFLAAKFIQFETDGPMTPTEALAVSLVLDAILILNSLGVSAAKTDTAGVFLLFAAWFASILFTAYILDNNGEPIEPNKDAIDTLTGFKDPSTQQPRSVASFAPYPARVEDNIPPAPLTSFPFDDIYKVDRHFGIYHQKMSIVKTSSTAHIGYCGGIDCNPDRLDTVDHLAKAPYHDVHTRIEGSAVHDLALTFEQRWGQDGNGSSAFAVPDASTLGAPGRDIAQIARTYFAPAPSAPDRAFSFAREGDRTIANTMIAALRSARETIHVEDQYLVPPGAYRDTIVAKVANREIRQLVIVVPGILDLLFGDATRNAFVNDLIAADAGAGIFRIGYPRRRFTSTDNTLRASSGKMLLMQDLDAGGGPAPSIFLGPAARIPDVPFWVSVEGELMYVYDESSEPNPDSEHMKVFLCERGDSTRIVAGSGPGAGAFPRAHKAGAAATAVDLSQIYVHAKMMIVDDVFLGIGSANLNHRGLFYDGEVNCFTIPDALRASPRNPAYQLRRQLWAEMMDLPEDMIAPLLGDPIAAAKLFDRSPFVGNRFTPLDAQPPVLMRGYTTGDGALADIFQGLGFTVLAANFPTIFQQVTDPSSRTELAP
jgi:phosphatidylserine/phosphatidylglycerophosphate/cardiolipin synthase-like enzyme